MLVCVLFVATIGTGGAAVKGWDNKKNSGISRLVFGVRREIPE